MLNFLKEPERAFQKVVRHVVRRSYIIEANYRKKRHRRTMAKDLYYRGKQHKKVILKENDHEKDEVVEAE